MTTAADPGWQTPPPLTPLSNLQQEVGHLAECVALLRATYCDPAVVRALAEMVVELARMLDRCTSEQLAEGDRLRLAGASLLEACEGVAA